MTHDDDRRLVRLFLAGRPASTQRAYQLDLDLFFSAIGKPLRELSYEDLVAFLESLSGSGATRARRFCTVRSFLGFGHRVGALPSQMLPPAPRPVRRLQERILTEEEVRQVVHEARSGRDRCLIRLLYLGGLRIAEALNLRWRDVRDRWVSVVGKGARPRTVLLPKAFVEELLLLRGESDPTRHVFTNVRGGRLSDSYARRVVRRAALEATDKPASPHWLRHSHASHALNRGAPIHVVAQGLGHASVATTTAYLHVRPDQGASQYLVG
jgi:integrase/recombinase XerD